MNEPKSPVVAAARAHFNAAHGHTYKSGDAWAHLSPTQRKAHEDHMRVALEAYSATASALLAAQRGGAR